MAQENRLHPRLLVHMPGEYRLRGSDEWQKAMVRDLSAGGATLLTSTRIAAQTALRLRFELTEEKAPRHPIEVETLVLRAGAEAGGGGNIRHRAALHFLDLQGELFERVRRYVFDRQGEKPA